ncbi:hypothetical protein HPB50_015009 [Hyalomma asiaticum]|uniref:Uncharacterized protein n=1 Tax=Hyalomma asiaticum TaxID=266040 RepID=A0ACB7RU24_HYAAI|nr:hypothetical protein HPB50_015009 [Hyalomma asiaticum]
MVCGRVMACSVDSVSAAASGRGVRGCSLPAGYKLLLPTLPSDETMKLCVFLHCDVGGRPYRIEDFRSPLEELGVLKAVLTGEREITEIDGGTSFELTEHEKEADKIEEPCLKHDQGASAKMDVDPALLKRRHEEDDGVKERVQRELQPEWKIVTGKKGKYVPRTRAASLTRDARSDE